MPTVYTQFIYSFIKLAEQHVKNLKYITWNPSEADSVADHAAISSPTSYIFFHHIWLWNGSWSDLPWFLYMKSTQAASSDRNTTEFSRCQLNPQSEAGPSCMTTLVSGWYCRWISSEPLHSSDTTYQLQVTGEQGHSLGMDGAQVGISEETHKKCFSSLWGSESVTAK